MQLQSWDSVAQKLILSLLAGSLITAAKADVKSLLSVKKAEIHKVALEKTLDKFQDLQPQDLSIRDPELLRVHCVAPGWVGVPAVESRFEGEYCFAMMTLYQKSTVSYRKIEVHSRCFDSEKYQSVDVWYFEDGYVHVGEFNESLSRGEISCDK